MAICGCKRHKKLNALVHENRLFISRAYGPFTDSREKQFLVQAVALDHVISNQTCHGKRRHRVQELVTSGITAGKQEAPWAGPVRRTPRRVDES